MGKWAAILVLTAVLITSCGPVDSPTPFPVAAPTLVDRPGYIAPEAARATLRPALEYFASAGATVAAATREAGGQPQVIAEPTSTPISGFETLLPAGEQSFGYTILSKSGRYINVLISEQASLEHLNIVADHFLTTSQADRPVVVSIWNSREAWELYEHCQAVTRVCDVPDDSRLHIVARVRLPPHGSSREDTITILAVETAIGGGVTLAYPTPTPLPELVWHTVNRGDFPEEGLLTRIMAVETGVGGGYTGATVRRDDIMDGLKVLLKILSEEADGSKIVKVWVHDAAGDEWERVRDCQPDCEIIRRNYDRLRLAFGQFDPTSNDMILRWQGYDPS